MSECLLEHFRIHLKSLLFLQESTIKTLVIKQPFSFFCFISMN